MDDERGPRDQVFLVRMWPARQASERHIWRGSIQHVPSGRRLYVSGLADVLEFITTELSESTAEERAGS
jgi:hypothetical protein